jgi:hypothetical protein
MTRYLRFAASGFFVLLAVALIGLWVRSHYWFDTATARFGHGQCVSVGSVRGIVLVVSMRDADELERTTGFKLAKSRVTPLRESLTFSGFLGFWGTSGSFLALSGTSVSVPYWFLIVTALALAVLVSLKRSWRFSLRTMFVLTTLLAAIAFGLGTYFL